MADFRIRAGNAQDELGVFYCARKQASTQKLNENKPDVDVGISKENKSQLKEFPMPKLDKFEQQNEQGVK